MVLPVGDVDVAVLVEGDPPGLVELAVAAAGPAAFADKLAVRAEDLQAVVAAVDDDYVAVLFDREAGGAQQFAITAAGRAPFAQEITAAVEHRDRVCPVVRHVDVVVVVDRDPERPSAISLAFAVFAKIGDVLFFAGAAELHLVDVHPEIIFVAAVGGIENAVFAEAHRLNIIEPRAAGGVAPDGMAPIKHPSFRDRGERHRAPPL